MRMKTNISRLRRAVLRMTVIVAVGLGGPIAIAWMVIAQPVLWYPSPASQFSVNSERLAQHVHLLSTTFAPRNSEHPQNLDRAAAYIKGQFEAAHGQVSEQSYNIGGKTYRNVIAMFGPETHERMVIGAHYDAFDTFPGADDNASGVAGIIELAYLLGGALLPMRVEVVAFTLEEPPYFDTSLMGSAVHAQSLKVQGVTVRTMIALEMIGYFSDAPASQHVPVPLLRLFYPSRGNFIAVIGNLDQRRVVRRIKKAMQGAVQLPVYSMNGPRFIQGIDYSDHRSYWEAGFPAVMITDTAFYRNDKYHTVQDTLERLDYARMGLVVQSVHAAVLDLATASME